MSLATLLGGWLALATPPVVDEEVLYFDGEAVAEVFEDEAYRFCRPEHRPRYVTRRTCALAALDEHEDCPGLARACDELSPEPEEPTPSGGGFGWDVLRWLLLAGAVLLVADQLRRLGRRPRHRTEGISSDSPSPPKPTELPPTPAREVLAAAERALDRGEARRALGLLQQSLHRHIQDAQILSFDPAFTHRDYLRKLRGRPELGAVYRPFAALANRMRFGDGAVDRDRLAELLARCRGLFLGLLLFSAACGGPRPPSFESHAPNGLSALVDMLRAWGYEVQLYVGEVDAEAEYDLLLARTVPFLDYVGEEADYGIYRRVLEGWPIVLLDDGRSLAPLADGVRRRPTAGDSPTTYTLTQTSSCGIDPRFFLETDDLDLEVPFMHELAWPADEPPTLDDPDVAFGHHGIATRRVENEGRSIANLYTYFYEAEDYVIDTCVVHFPSSAFASNESLTRPDNRALMLGIVAGLTPNRGRIAVVDALGLNAQEEAGQVRVEQSPVLPVLLQLGLCLCLWYWARGMSFGLLRDPVKEGRRAFVEHTDAVGEHLAASGTAGEFFVVRTLAKSLGPQRWDEPQIRATSERLGVPVDVLRQALAASRGEEWTGEPLLVAAALSRLLHEGR